MMRIRIRWLLWAVAAVAGVWVSVLPAIGAPLIVPDYGDTGWQTYSHEFPTGWWGTFGIGVANYGDMVNDSQLLIDNINVGPPENFGFEKGTFSGYDAFGFSNFIVRSVDLSDTYWYRPTEGMYMASLLPSYYEDASGSIEYVDGSEWGGSNSAYITFQLDVKEETELSFAWAFLAGDDYLHADFAFVFSRGIVPSYTQAPLQSMQLLAAVVPGGDSYFEIIARIGGQPQMSEPYTIVLFAMGVVGLCIVRFRK